MPGIIGFIGKEVLALKCILGIHEDAILKSAGRFGGWSAIIYQSGDVFLRSHPFSCGDTRSIMELLREVDSELLIFKLYSPNTPPPQRWNIQPFRFRNWVYAQHGKIDGFNKIRENIQNAMPDFLSRSLKGTTDAEAVFHLLLSFLYDTGKLDTKELDIYSTMKAMKHTIEFLKRSCEEKDCGDFSISMILANGAILCGYNSSHTGVVSIFEGRGTCEKCNQIEKCSINRYSSMTRAGLVMILDNFPETFKNTNFLEIANDSFFAITHDVTYESIPNRSSFI